MRARKSRPLLLCAACALVLGGAARGSARDAASDKAVPDSTSLIVHPAPPAAVSVSSGSIRDEKTAGPPPETGLGRLEVAWMLHPYARSAIKFLESIDKMRSWNPMYRCRPGEMLDAWEDMLRRHFKSVRRIERLEEAEPGRLHLVLNLDLHLKFGAVSGSNSRVTAQVHIHRPDGTRVEHLQAVSEKIVPYPAASNMMFEAFMGALDGLETDLAGSAPLAAFEKNLPQR